VVLGKASDVGMYLIFHNIQYKVRGEFSIFADLNIVMDYALKKASLSYLVNHSFKFQGDIWLAVGLKSHCLVTM